MNQLRLKRNDLSETNLKIGVWCCVHAQYGRWQSILRYKFFLTFLGTLLLLLLSIAPVRANAITVDIDVPAVNNDGFCSLIEAIENAEDTTTGQPHSDCDAGDPAGADTINLSNTTYSLTNDYASSGTGLPAITTDIIIEGNGATIERDAASVDEFRIFFVSGTGSLIINNLTILGGFNPSNSAGGIYSNGSLTLNDSVITGNTGSTGGGIENDRGLTTINNTTITNNTATIEGGGGVWNNADGIMSINNSLIMGNSTATGNGGAIVNAALFGRVPQLTINDSTITGNFALGTNHNGGGIANIEGFLTVNRSTIDHNTTGGIGGGVYNTGNGTIEINQSTISNNTASDDAGGGIGSEAVGATIQLSLNNVTITGNDAATSGGGIFTYAFTGIATLNLNRTIVSGNSSSAGREHYNSGGTIIADNYNLFGYDNDSGLVGTAAGASDVVPGTGIMVSDILETSLANNGTKPHPDTHALVLGSPAIDAAPSAACTTPPNDVDQRGGIRNVDGDASPSSNECDIGAFEFASTVDPTSISIQRLGADNRISSHGQVMISLVAVLLVLTAVVVVSTRRG